MVLRRTARKDLESGAGVLQRLARMASAGCRGPDATTGEVLRAGCELLALEAGEVAEVERKRYRIVAAVGPDEVRPATGTVLDLASTFAALVVEEGEPVALRSTRGKELASHPAHENQGFGCYLGMPLRVGGKLVGTLSFGDRRPRRRAFNRAELHLLELLGEQVSRAFELLRLEERLSDASKRLAENKVELERIATQDPITGVLNRRTVLARLAHERSRAQREGRPVGVFLMNVDRLREINGNFGHQVGDRVLSEIAQRVAGSLRAYDHLGRFAAGEFLAILPGCSLQQAAEIAERAREAVEDAPFSTDRGAVTITGSFGVTSTDDLQLSADALLSFADKALYLAKQGGRNCVKGAMPMEMAAP